MFKVIRRGINRTSYGFAGQWVLDTAIADEFAPLAGRGNSTTARGVHTITVPQCTFHTLIVEISIFNSNADTEVLLEDDTVDTALSVLITGVGTFVNLDTRVSVADLSLVNYNLLILTATLGTVSYVSTFVLCDLQ